MRDDAVFWFYAGKDRFLTLSDVLDVKSPTLVQVDDAMRSFVTLAGPYFNSYAFCDPAKQREASQKSITWVETHPYQALFIEQFPALPGDRAENLNKSLERIKTGNLAQKRQLDDPKFLKAFNEKRKENHVEQQFCWKE